MYDININFNEPTGKVKPLHGLCMPPLIGNHNTSLFHYLKEAGIPNCRLHDVGGSHGGTHLVDVENIFKNMDADENDPASYDFAFTDNLIKALVENDCEPFYRLGATIENGHGIKYYHIAPPKDNLKWAKICGNIIRHYNEGWANGFHYNIKYWEIWNEPDGHPEIENSATWKGTKEQFFELYKVTSNYLKSEFPSLKIGGYSSCGFYVTSEVPQWVKDANSTDRFEYFVEFFVDFLEYISKPENKSPLDFFSWHSYETGDNTVRHAEYCRKMLDKYGFTETESILNEWNPDHIEKGTALHASKIAAYIITMHSSPVDMMGFYGGSVYSGYGALLSPMPPYRPLKEYYVFWAFNRLYKLGTAVKTICNKEGVYALAATNGTKNALLISNRCPDTESTFTLDAELFKGKEPVAHLIDDDYFYTEVPCTAQSGRITLRNHATMLIEW